MEIKYTNQFLNKLEDLFAESNYVLRYEKGSFKPGYCVLKDTRIVIVNKYYPTEGRINCLIEIIRTIDDIDTSRMNDKNKKLYQEICQIQETLFK